MHRNGATASRPPSACSSTTHRRPGHVGPGVLEQPRRCGEGATGGQHVVDDHDVAATQQSRPSAGISSAALPYSRSYCSAVHRRRQFAALADGEHAGAQPVGDGRRHQEPAGIDAGHQVGAGRDVRPARRSPPPVPSRSANSGVRSLNCTPGCGKSATSRVSDAMISASDGFPATLVTAPSLHQGPSVHVPARAPAGRIACSRHTSSSTSAACAAAGTAATSACRPRVPGRSRSAT